MSATKKSTSIPTRFEKVEIDFIDQVKMKTRLGKSEIIRRAVRFAGPKFLSGEVDILTLEGAHL
jgi:hypothetical protein